MTEPRSKIVYDSDAAVAICHALGIDPDHCSNITITIDAPGRFVVEYRGWAPSIDAPEVAEQFKRMGAAA